MGEVVRDKIKREIAFFFVCFNTLYRAPFIVLYDEPKKCAIISQIITLLLHVSTLSYHPREARS